MHHIKRLRLHKIRSYAFLSHKFENVFTYLEIYDQYSKCTFPQELIVTVVFLISLYYYYYNFSLKHNTKWR